MPLPTSVFNRHRIATLVAILSLVSTSCDGTDHVESKSVAQGDTKLSFSITAQLAGEEPVEALARVLFANKYAVSAVLDSDAENGAQWDHLLLFDLERMAWYDSALQRWVDLKSCQAWEKATLDRTRQSLATSADTEVNAFVEATINPRFQVQTRDDGTIVISNSHLMYSITPTDNATPQLLERFLAYDVLNAYHKAMTERKLAPTAQLAVDDILAQQKILPKQLTMRIKSPTGPVVYTAKWKVEPFDDSDNELIQRATSALKP